MKNKTKDLKESLKPGKRKNNYVGTKINMNLKPNDKISENKDITNEMSDKHKEIDKEIIKT